MIQHVLKLLIECDLKKKKQKNQKTLDAWGFSSAAKHLPAKC